MSLTRRILSLARPGGRIFVRSAGLLVELSGYGLLCGGLWLVWPPLSFVVGGAILVVLAQGVRLPNDAVR